MKMSNNLSKFILEEQNNEFKFGKNRSKIYINFNRVASIFFIFFLIALIYSIHLLHLGNRKNSSKSAEQIKILNKLHRADILDRNGSYLAKTVSSIDVGINPIEAIDKKKLLLNLKYIFPNKDYELIKSKLDKNKFFWFEKKISEENYEKMMMLGDKSIKPEQKITRIYPQKNLFSHIIGQIDEDNFGISGLEKSFDEKLKNNDEAIKLTLDRDIQYLIREELLRYNKIFKTIGSAAILMNVDNGEIISIVSLPDFDPNKRTNITDVNYINRSTKGVYEFGSVFKTFTLAAAFNNDSINSKTEFKNLEKSIKCGKNIIREYDEKIPSDLTAEEILIRSGNIGSVRIGQSVGLENYKKFLNDLKLIRPINFDIEEVGVPVAFKWGKCKLATVSYGHGITTTILQLANAYSILANGGFEIKPSLTKNVSSYKKKEF